MTDILIRGLSDETVARIDRQADRFGLARVEYLRRTIEAEAARVAGQVTPTDWEQFGTLTADLRRPGFEDQAWGRDG